MIGCVSMLTKCLRLFVNSSPVAIAICLLSDAALLPLSAIAQEGLPSLSSPPAERVLPAPVPTTPQVSAPLPMSETAYILGPGDIVNVDIFRVNQYSGDSQVLIDGTLNLSLIGKVSVEGLTLQQAAEVLSAQYAQFLRRPIVTVTLSARRPLQLAIAGEVNRPGSYTINQNNTESARLSQLLETAGGTTQAANLSQVLLSRVQPDGSRQDIAIDLLALVQSGDLSQDVTLRDGDSIVIPTSQTPLQNSGLIADASFSSDGSQPINVAVIGEVYRPGPHTLQAGGGSNANSPTTITRAIQAAGGIKPKADIRSVQVVRPTRAGNPQVFEVDLWKLLDAGDIQQDAILQAGDTVFVPVATALTPAEVSRAASVSFSPETVRVNIVGEVKRPGVVDLPPNTPLSQGILAAGGFNNTRADTGTAELVRLQDDGTVARESISVDFAQGINDDSNPLLRNNDVVIVNRNGLASVTDTLSTITGPFGGLFSIFRFFDLFD